MEQRFHQAQKQVQAQTFTPQLGQSLEILQASALELRNVILKELESNPVLEELPMQEAGLEEVEIDSEEDVGEEKDEGLKELKFEEKYNELQGAIGHYTKRDEAKRQHFLDSLSIEMSLQESIMEQAKLSGCTKDELSAMEFLVGSLDDKGFLTASISELSNSSRLSKDVLSRSLEILKTFEPLGLGSCDVQECLLLQLKASGRENSRATEVVKNHYSLLLRKKVPELARTLDLTMEQIKKILEEIAALDPAPGRKFGEDNNRTVVADARIEKIGDNWIVSLNNEYIPNLRLSKTYKDLIVKGHLTAKEKEYIQEKMRSGKLILNAIEQRQKTLERITEGILKFQKNFFEKGVSELHPLTMSGLGESLKMHEATISRAVANKFLETPHGLFPYKYFFTTGYNVPEKEDGLSNTSIKEEIAKIIKSEPTGKPYSDLEIVGILKQNGIVIARRTVAKYREELGILTRSLRKKF